MRGDDEVIRPILGKNPSRFARPTSSSSIIRSRSPDITTRSRLSYDSEIPENKVKQNKTEYAIKADDKVEGNYRGRGKWYPGKITRDRGDGTYDISYDDGESEMRVTSDMIRPRDSELGSSIKKAVRLEEGDKIEGNYRGRGKWYPGKITRDR
eukprot:gene20591-26699_t